MIQIRQGVFETNSSSTHSITISPQSEFNKWKDRELYLNRGWWHDAVSDVKDKTFLTKDEAIGLVLLDGYCSENQNLYDMDDNELEDCFKDNGIYTYNNYFYEDYLEGYEERYTTESGDEIIAFGRYGYC